MTCPICGAAGEATPELGAAVIRCTARGCGTLWPFVPPEPLGDSHRRALAFMAAAIRGDDEGAAVILGDAAPDPVVFGMTLGALARCIRLAAERFPDLEPMVLDALRNHGEEGR